MEYLPFEIDGLTEELIEKARIELGETNEKRKATITEMRARVKEDTKLYCSTEDDYLLEFLRPKKFNVEKAVTLLHNYYRMKKSCKDVFDKRKYDVIVQACRTKVISVMPYRDEDGAVIMLIQARYWNYKSMPFSDIVHATVCIIIGLVDLHPATQVCGLKLIFDTKGLSLKYFFHMNPRYLHVVSKAISVCAPARLKAIHVINESIVVKHVWNIVKFVLSEKLKKRVHFHSTNIEGLTRKMNPTLIPKDIGGTLKYDNSFWIKFTAAHEHKYSELIEYGYKS